MHASCQPARRTMQICTYVAAVGAGVCDTCAPRRFDIRYTFTIAQAIDTSLHRYRCLVQSEFFVLRTLHTPWYTPSRVGEHWLCSIYLSVFLARGANARDRGRSGRRARQIFAIVYTEPNGEKFSDVCCSRHEGAGIYATQDLFLPRNCTSNFRYRKLHVSPARTPKQLASCTGPSFVRRDGPRCCNATQNKSEALTYSSNTVSSFVN